MVDSLNVPGPVASVWQNACLILQSPWLPLHVGRSQPSPGCLGTDNMLPKSTSRMQRPLA